MYGSSASRLRVAVASRQLFATKKRAFTASARFLDSAPPPTPAAGEVAPPAEGQTTSVAGGPAPTAVTTQAPNRSEVWSRSQNPRSNAMTGPRFEQTDFELQPRPWAAIELIHKQPVRWTHDRVVACDGGGGPAGHPKVYINVDKPEITPCGYCGLPFANEHHREHLQSLPETSYPLS
ncbi:hypothetical protein QBC35DRAFT_490390 [Podospora australis]|uniref:Zinc finger CHCC-type domain-containing protein n=1 Tax=Podospora australis TaxID=1536484 RepID=A0AAN7ALG5_9PEZI|nr:hypothetical protein QBC35DRAFT_490390 [Podospora australis]